MGRFPTERIETDRLRLAPLRPADAIAMVGVLADPSLYAFMGAQPPTFDELDARYRRWSEGSPRLHEDWHNWVVRLANGVAIGHAQATVTDRGRVADIAWIVGVPWQGTGYASEAARALVGWLERAGVTTVTAHVHPDHLASARVASKAGLEATDDREDGEVVWRRVRA